MAGFVDLIYESFTAGDLAIGLIIGFIATLMMSQYAQIILYAIIAFIFDQIIIPLARMIVDNNSFELLFTEASDILVGFYESPRLAILRLAFYFMVISALYVLKTLFKN